MTASLTRRSLLRGAPHAPAEGLAGVIKLVAFGVPSRTQTFLLDLR